MMESFVRIPRLARTHGKTLALLLAAKILWEEIKYPADFANRRKQWKSGCPRTCGRYLARSGLDE